MRMRPTAVIERRAGLFRTEYEAATLRENLGLQAASSFFVD
jgi:hypothetical protein